LACHFFVTFFPRGRQVRLRQQEHAPRYRVEVRSDTHTREIEMKSKLAVAAAVGATLLLAAAPAQARWYGHHHHHGWGWGAGAAGFAAGALIGGALARPYYGGPAYYYGEPAYAYAPGDDEAYCEQRFRSYDPRSGTYLGYDGRRHPCP
jgi:hypothetical protein